MTPSWLARVVTAALVAATVVVATPRLATAGKPAQILKLLPDSTTMLAVANVKASRKAKLFPTLSGPALAGAESLTDTLTAAGVDPVKAIDQLVIAVTGTVTSLGQSNIPFVAIAEGRFPAGMLAKGKGVAATYAGVTSYTLAGYESAVIGKRLITTRAGQLAAVIDVIQGKAKNVATSKKSATLRAAVAATDTGQHGWFVAKVEGVLDTLLSAVGIDATWMSMTGMVGTTLSVEVGLALASADVARTMATDATTRVTSMASTLKNLGFADAGAALVFAADGSILRATTRFTAAEVASLLQLADQFI